MKDEFVELRLELALHECIEYLKYQAIQYGFDYKVGEKTTIALNKILREFSVSQVYQIILYAIKNATAFQVKNRTTKLHAMNTIPSCCLSYSEKAQNNNWKLNGYNRDFKCPRSALSIVLYEQLLKRGDSGFTEVCSIIKPSFVELNENGLVN